MINFSSLPKRPLERLSLRGTPPHWAAPNPHLGNRRTTHLKPAVGASGGLPKQAAKEEFLAESLDIANDLAKGKADKRAFRAWFTSLSAEDQAFAREHKIHVPMPAEGFRRGAGGEDALDLAEREIIPEADIRGTRNGKAIVAVGNAAIDYLEPEDCAVDVKNLSPEEVRAAAEDFGDALRWALEPQGGEVSLVDLGRRSAVVIAGLRNDLAGGLPIHGPLARSFLESFHDFRMRETLDRLSGTGAIYGRVLEWMRRAKDLAGLGERLQLVAYELRPDLIEAGTLAELGSLLNKTRQAKDKVVNCLRDTFDGLRAITMRSDVTRLRCQSAQLATA